MGINDETKIVLGSLRYKSAPETNLSVNITLNQTEEEFVEFDRNVDIGLEQVFDDERQSSTIFRPTTKFSILFKNVYSGSTTYNPFKNYLYYTNEVNNAISSTTIPNFPWEGNPQYFEFDFIRTDNNLQGYTQPPNNHITFVNKSASTYNWTHYLSYPYENAIRQLFLKDQKTGASFTWFSSQGIPFIIEEGNDVFGKRISFRCNMKHGLSINEYVVLSTSYNGENVFQVVSLGNEGFGSEEYIFNINNVGFTGVTFNTGVQGTFKRAISKTNLIETTSKYYVRRHKILTNVNDAILVNAGFEQNIFRNKTKNEVAILTPNNVGRSSLLEGGQSYTLSFNVDTDIDPLRDNQNRPITELFFTTIWKGYFGWTNPLKKGYEFNLPLDGLNSSSWWSTANIASNAFELPTSSYNSETTPPQGPFIYTEDLSSGDVIDGDFCEWNDFDLNERVISKLYHKITFNQNWFFINTPATNKIQYGYYYSPHNSITIRKYSDYIEEGDPNQVINIPDYAVYSTLSNSFRWRDIYSYGYIDSSNNGVDYPFINGKHYPFVNTIFRIIPEGTNLENINEIAEPIIDECE